MSTDDTIRRGARFHLNELIEQVIAAHEQLKLASRQASSNEAADAYAKRYLVLSELEEFLADAVVELSPDEMYEVRLSAT